MIQKPTTTPQFGIEQRSRLSPAILELLNTQIKNELYSAQIYASFASWLDKNNFTGGSKLFLKYSKEEIGHMYKLYDYIFSRNSEAKTSDLPPVKIELLGVRSLLEQSLQHEIQITKNWLDIASASCDERDHTTYELAQWYIKEQVEEEEKFREFLQHLDIGLPTWRLDEKFAESV